MFGSLRKLVCQDFINPSGYVQRATKESLIIALMVIFDDFEDLSLGRVLLRQFHIRHLKTIPSEASYIRNRTIQTIHAIEVLFAKRVVEGKRIIRTDCT